MFGLFRRLIGMAAGNRGMSRQHTEATEYGSAPASPCAEAVWTPKGYVTLTTAPVGFAAGVKYPHLSGGSGYGSRDTSPPGCGYGIGRAYD